MIASYHLPSLPDSWTRLKHGTGVALVALALGALGCAGRDRHIHLEHVSSASPVSRRSPEIALTSGVTTDTGAPTDEMSLSVPPFDLSHESPVAYQELTLEQTIEIALNNSSVMRDLGARAIQSPDLLATTYEPSLQSTDPQAGVEAALSAFDAQVLASGLFDSTDRALNNRVQGQGVRLFKQQLNTFRSELSKRAVTGTQFAVRHDVIDTSNNATSQNLVPRAWDWIVEGEVRQPLLHGSGVQFNRIAGPNSVPGIYNGIMIAQTNTAISVQRLEVSLRDYLNNVENAYWDLYYAYRDLEVKREARDRALETLKQLENRKDLRGAEQEKVEQAREQYFRFEQDVQNALGGRVLDGTRSSVSSLGGTFQATSGVYVAERRLRSLIGWPITDGRLINPISTPRSAPIVFDWEQIVEKALSRRTELTMQQTKIRRDQLELLASRNFLLPQLDAVGRYRFRGLSNELYNTRLPNTEGTGSISTDNQEWLLGMELTQALGMRQGHAAVRHAELRLARDHAALRELERQVVQGLSNAVAENNRATTVLNTATQRRLAAAKQLNYLSAPSRLQVRDFDFNLLLDAQRRLVEAEIAENQATIERALALKNVYFEMGELLEYYNVHLAHSGPPCPPQSPSASHGHAMNYIIDPPAKTVAEPEHLQVPPAEESAEPQVGSLLPIEDPVAPGPSK